MGIWCYFWPLCLPVKMGSKTVIRPITVFFVCVFSQKPHLEVCLTSQIIQEKKNTGKLEKLFEQSSTQYFNIAIHKLCKNSILITIICHQIPVQTLWILVTTLPTHEIQDGLENHDKVYYCMTHTRQTHSDITWSNQINNITVFTAHVKFYPNKH